MRTDTNAGHVSFDPLSLVHKDTDLTKTKYLDSKQPETSTSLHKLLPNSNVISVPLLSGNADSNAAKPERNVDNEQIKGFFPSKESEVPTDTPGFHYLLYFLL